MNLFPCLRRPLLLASLSCVLLLPAAYAAPLASEAVLAKPIGEVSAESFGILTEKQGGFPSAMWQGTDRDTARRLLLLLPAKPVSPVATELKRRLLLTSAEAPEGSAESEDASLFLLRLKQLAVMGDEGSVEKLLAALPSSRLTSEMAQLHVASLFIADKVSAACTLTRKYVAQYQKEESNRFWRKSLIVCQTLDGKPQEAEFSLHLLEEDGVTPSPDFLTMLTQLGNKETQKAGKEQWSALLRTGALSLSPELTSSPKLRDKWIARLSGFRLSEWNQKYQSDADGLKTSAVARIAALAEALGEPVSHEEWRTLLSAPPRADAPISIASLSMLSSALQEKHIAEAVALIVITLGERPASALPDSAAVALVSALKTLGHEKLAAQLAGEAAGN